MRVTLLLCALVVTLVAADSVFKPADKQFAQRQYDLLHLFVNLYQPSYVQQEITLANTFDFHKYVETTTNKFAVKEFEYAYERGVLLPRGEVFNYFNPTHLRQAVQLFDFFFFARDYASFYQATCWARNHVNEMMFAYSLSVAVLNRPETQGMVVPPMSEVVPYMYLHTRAFQLADFYKQQGYKQATVVSNNTDMYAYNILRIMNKHQAPNTYPYTTETSEFPVTDSVLEGRLSYYREDVHLNQQFAFEQLKNPSWFSGQKYPIKRQTTQNNGEFFYYFLQQILARYNLERYANDLPFLRPISFDRDIEFGYSPMIQYYNGEVMPFRADNLHFTQASERDLYRLQQIDRRLVDMVDSREALVFDGTKVPLTLEDGVRILGNILQNNGDSVHPQYYSAVKGFYGYLDQCRRVVASVVDSDNQHYTAPGVIEMDHTAHRDPVFYQCLNRFVQFFKTFKDQAKPYTTDDLVFPGVKVQGVTTDKLITFFDLAEVDLFNAISYKEGETAEKFYYKGQQLQLNYKPFTYQIRVDSDKTADVIVRVFFGPKYDVMGRALSVEQARQYMVEVDRFLGNVTTGQNTIHRSSKDSTRFTQTLSNTRQLFRTLQQAQQGGQTYYYNQFFSQMWATMPQSLLLPRGSRSGLEYVFVVTVHPYQSTQSDSLAQLMPVDSRPQGFPFDRVLGYESLQAAQNIFFQTVKIFHKTQEETNSLNL